MTRLSPTDEQLAALELFKLGDDMKIEAGAGTGKTSTLHLLASRSPEMVGQYVAFNRSISDDAAKRMPGNVSARTVHSLAMGALGRQYAHRLKSQRMRSEDIARYLRLKGFTATYGKQKKHIASGHCGSMVMATLRNFCHSDDDAPGFKHVPYQHGIDPPGTYGKGWSNNMKLRGHIMDAVYEAWVDIQKRHGYLTFRHEHYLKLWQLTRPVLPIDFLMIDEAQDTNPVMAAIYGYQTEAQCVYVGDSQQQVYEFMGAVNAMDKIDDSAHVSYLTQSFRFGPDIANVANLLLTRIKAPIRLTGLASIESEVGPFPYMPYTVLTRTNAGSVREMLSAIRDGLRPHLIGGGTEVAKFCQAAKKLQNGERTSHPELACFESWAEVRLYVEEDPSGDELKLLVELIDEFGVDVILNAVGDQPPEQYADIVISTAHKAKGREWDHVRIGGDFAVLPADRMAEKAELRLAYVAATRAKRNLDDRMLRAFYTESKHAHG